MVLDAFCWFSLIITTLTLIIIFVHIAKNRELVHILEHIPAVFGWTAALMFEILYYFKIY